MNLRFHPQLLIAALFLGNLASNPGQCEVPLPYYDAKDLSPFWEAEQAKESGAASHQIARVNSFGVIDQEGRPITEKNFEGKISLVNFFFGQCGSVCPTMMSAIQKLQKKLKAMNKDSMIRIYSFSTMPQHDSPAELKNYAKRRGIDLSNWSLVTGDPQVIYGLGKGVFKADRSIGSQRSESSFIHTSNLYMVDAKLRIRGVYNTESTQQMALLSQDIAKLEQER